MESHWLCGRSSIEQPEQWILSGHMNVRQDSSASIQSFFLEDGVNAGAETECVHNHRGTILYGYVMNTDHWVHHISSDYYVRPSQNIIYRLKSCKKNTKLYSNKYNQAVL